MAGARLALLTRPGCHLCEAARQAMRRVAEISGEPWIERDVTLDPDLEREYGDRLPVVLLDGREHGYWRVEQERLLRDLAAPGDPPASGGPPVPGGPSASGGTPAPGDPPAPGGPPAPGRSGRSAG